MANGRWEASWFMLAHPPDQRAPRTAPRQGGGCIAPQGATRQPSVVSSSKGIRHRRPGRGGDLGGREFRWVREHEPARFPPAIRHCPFGASWPFGARWVPLLDITTPSGHHGRFEDTLRSLARTGEGRLTGTTRSRSRRATRWPASPWPGPRKADVQPISIDLRTLD